MRQFTHTLLAALVLTVALPFFAAGQVSGQTAGQETGHTVGRTLTPSEARRQARLFDEHVVKMGQTAFSIARGYAISPKILAEDNPGVDLTQVRVGQMLLIRKKERGKTDPAQVAREWQELMSAATEKGADDVPADISQNTSQGDHPNRDSLWSVLGDPTADGSGVYHRPEGIPVRRELGDFSREGTPRIALMLPLSGTTASAAGNDYTDFYKGALLALENLKSQGRSAIVTLYDSGRSVDKMQSIVTSADFIDTDLIIGPVWEEELEPAVRFGEFFSVPVVSPLIPTLRSLDSEIIYQMAPDPSARYDKLRPLFKSDANIILVSSEAGNDAEFEREIMVELGGRNYSRFAVPVGGGGDFASLLDWERPNVLIVLAGNEAAVDRALATISTSHNNASARRGNRKADITVVGSSKWAGYDSIIDENLLFKLNVKFITSYYIDRSNMETRLFEARYAEMYGDFPSSRSAFRGYDAVSMFAGALFERGFSFADRLEKVGATPLATPYRFVQQTGGAFGHGGTLRHVNDQWTLVSYSSDYNITTQ